VVQALAQGPARVTGCRPQSFKRLFPLIGGPEHGHEDTGVAKIGRDLDGGNGHQADAGILNFSLNDFTDLYSELLFDSVNSTSLHLL
jgi:hypothetical protein